jgi:hypothetical protein
MDKQALRLLIHQKLAAGPLPSGRMLRVWRGAGNGTLCDACGEVLSRRDVMLEGFTATVAAIRFHRHCFDLWNHERFTLRA